MSQKSVSYMAPGIHQMNARSWETLVISIFFSRHNKYCGKDPVPGNKFNSKQENNYIVNIAVDEILIREN